MMKTILRSTMLAVGFLALSPWTLTAQEYSVYYFEDFEDVTVPDVWGAESVEDATCDGWRFGVTDESTASFTVPAHPDGSPYAVSNDDAPTLAEDCDRFDVLYTPMTNHEGQDSLSLMFDLYLTGAFGSEGLLYFSNNGGVDWLSIPMPEDDDWQFLSVTLVNGEEQVEGEGPFVFTDEMVFAFIHSDGGAWATGMAVTNVALLGFYDPCDHVAELSCDDNVELELQGVAIGDWQHMGICEDFAVVGQPQLYTFTAEASGTHTLSVSDVVSESSEAYFQYYFKEASFDCDTLDWTCIGGFADAGEATFDLVEGVEYSILVMSEVPTPITQTFELTCPCVAEAGTLTADESPVCLTEGEAMISATEGDAPLVPEGYEVIYVLTEGEELTILDASPTPEFSVDAEGDYTIHTLVYDPETLDLTTVEYGVTTGVQVNGMLVQGGGDICGALDVTGASYVVEECEGLTCEDAPINVTHCYGNDADDQFVYVALNPGDLPTIVINSGALESCCDVLTIYDGDDTDAPVLYSGGGDLTDVTVQSTSGSLLVRVESDGSVSCADESTCCAAGLDWDVFCGQPIIPGCTDPLSVNYNPEATEDDGSCVLAGCEDAPINVTHCYGNDADDQFVYVALNPGDLPTIIFNNGTTESGWDDLTVYDGDDTDAPVLYTGSGDHSGVVVESTSGFLLVRIESDGVTSCASESTCCAAGLDWDVYCGQPTIPGCTDPLSVNYDPEATEDDGSCVVAGCEDAPINVTHCYGNDGDDQFLYSELNPGDLPTIYINSGVTESCCDVVTIYDGDDTDAPVLYTGGGDHAGVVAESTSGFLLVRIESDGSVSCASEDACCAEGLDWDVYCGQPIIPGCTDPLSVNYNPDATEDDGSCILPTCEDVPVNVTHCYGNDADDQFVYAALNPGDLPTIVINSGTTESGWDDLTVYDGDDTDAPVLYTGSGDHSGVIVESTSGFLLVRIESDGGVSCASESTCCAAGLDWDVYCGQLLVEDCNGVLGGTAFIDFCDECVGGDTGNEPCPLDCNGVDGGDAFVDECGTCVGGDTGEEACVEDCNGDFGGTAFEDECGECVGGDTGEEACEQDCNGDWGGTAEIDDCDECAGGNTGIDPCIPVGVADGQLDQSLNVYPNPNNGQFIVELEGAEGIGTMNIVDMMGRRVFTQGVNLNGSFRQSIDLSVAKGTYILQVITENGIATRKVQLH